MIVGIIRERWVPLDAHRCSSLSSGIAAFIGVRTWCLWVHPVSLGSLGCAMGVIGFIQGLWVHRGRPCVWLGSSEVRWVYCGAGLSLAAWIIGVRLGVSTIDLGSLCTFGSAMGVAGFIGLHSGCHQVHPVSLCSLGCALGLLGTVGCTLEVMGFSRALWIHGGSPWGSTGLSRVAGFIGVRPGVRRVDQGSLGSLDWSAPWVTCGSCWVIAVRIEDGRVH